MACVAAAAAVGAAQPAHNCLRRRPAVPRRPQPASAAVVPAVAAPPLPAVTTAVEPVISRDTVESTRSRLRGEERRLRAEEQRLRGEEQRSEAEEHQVIVAEPDRRPNDVMTSSTKEARMLAVLDRMIAESNLVLHDEHFSGFMKLEDNDIAMSGSSEH